MPNLPQLTAFDIRAKAIGKLTTRFELSPRCLEASKLDKSPMTIEDLVRENGRLLEEIAHYRKTVRVLSSFHKNMEATFDLIRNEMHNAFEELEALEHNPFNEWEGKDSDISII